MLKTDIPVWHWTKSSHRVNFSIPDVRWQLMKQKEVVPILKETPTAPLFPSVLAIPVVTVDCFTELTSFTNPTFTKTTRRMPRIKTMLHFTKGRFSCVLRPRIEGWVKVWIFYWTKRAFDLHFWWSDSAMFWSVSLSDVEKGVKNELSWRHWAIAEWKTIKIGMKSQIMIRLMRILAERSAS